MNIKRIEVEHEEDWHHWVERTPKLQFPSDWEIQIIPPFGGAMARFLVSQGDTRVSIYLDCYNALGYFDGPYWEVYPVDDDVARVAMHDVEGLMKLIKEALK